MNAYYAKCLRELKELSLEYATGFKVNDTGE